MSQLIKLEKRFENALEKLELALANINVSKVSSHVDLEDDLLKKNYHNNNDLLVRIEQLEEAAKNDAKQIDKLVIKLKEILEADND